MAVDLSQLTDPITAWAAIALTAWVLVAVATAWLGDQKGRSPVIWFLVGLVWGPFAVLLVGLAPRGASGQYYRCSECREPIRRQARLSPFCRSAIPTEPAP